ncbi:MAG TPA: ATP-binding protein [Polyangia bacterium]
MAETQTPSTGGAEAERDLLLERVRRQAAELETILAAIGDGIFIFAPDGSVRRMNRAAHEMAGFTEANAPASFAARTQHLRLETADGQPLAVAELPGYRALQGETLSGVILKMHPPGRDPRWVSASAAPILDEGGCVQGAVVTMTDVTRLYLLEEELRGRVEALARADTQKNDFLAMLGHELRNPLAAIAGASQLLELLGPNDPLSLAAHFRTIVTRQTAQVARLVDDLLDVSRLARGQITVDRRPLDLLDVVQQTLDAIRTFVGQRTDRLQITLPPGPIVVDGDPARLQQVLSNLLLNALKYTPRNGAIALTVETARDEVTVRVKDSGVGVPPEMLARIFEPFTQAKGSAELASGGLGLGLAVVRAIVELHGGTVAAFSEGPRQGTELVVRLPTLSPSLFAEDTTPCARPGLAPRGRTEGPLRVLIVEDSEDLAEAMATAVVLWGHRARLAHTGAAALEAAEAEPTDVVLLDLGLPDLDGCEVARRLRVRLPAVRLIALSGHTQPADHKRSAAAGFERHLDKPVDLRDLRAVLED